MQFLSLSSSIITEQYTTNKKTRNRVFFILPDLVHIVRPFFQRPIKIKDSLFIEAMLRGLFNNASAATISEQTAFWSGLTPVLK